jgi:hypothetical protein
MHTERSINLNNNPFMTSQSPPASRLIYSEMKANPVASSENVHVQIDDTDELCMAAAAK